MIAELYDFTFERLRQFRPDLKDVMNAYKKLYEKKTCGQAVKHSFIFYITNDT